MEAKESGKGPRGTVGSQERTLEASGAKNFKKEAVNRIKYCKAALGAKVS